MTLIDVILLKAAFCEISPMQIRLDVLWKKESPFTLLLLLSWGLLPHIQ